MYTCRYIYASKHEKERGLRKSATFAERRHSARAAEMLVDGSFFLRLSRIPFIDTLVNSASVIINENPELSHEPLLTWRTYLYCWVIERSDLLVRLWIRQMFYLFIHIYMYTRDDDDGMKIMRDECDTEIEFAPMYNRDALSMNDVFVSYTAKQKTNYEEGKNKQTDPESSSAYINTIRAARAMSQVQVHSTLSPASAPTSYASFRRKYDWTSTAQPHNPLFRGYKINDSVGRVQFEIFVRKFDQWRTCKSWK